MLDDSGATFIVDSAPSEFTGSDVVIVDYSDVLSSIDNRLVSLSDKADFFVGVVQVFVVFYVMTLLYRLFKIFF